MRIVGGIYRHRIINYPNDAEHIRPTKDRIREAIFSALGDLSGFKGLDLYSGSGAMGIEALSRGASFMTFVDKNKVAINTTKNNISSPQRWLDRRYRPRGRKRRISTFGKRLCRYPCSRRCR